MIKYYLGTTKNRASVFFAAYGNQDNFVADYAESIGISVTSLIEIPPNAVERNTLIYVCGLNYEDACFVMQSIHS